MAGVEVTSAEAKKSLLLTIQAQGLLHEEALLTSEDLATPAQSLGAGGASASASDEDSGGSDEGEEGAEGAHHPSGGRMESTLMKTFVKHSAGDLGLGALHAAAPPPAAAPAAAAAAAAATAAAAPTTAVEL